MLGFAYTLPEIAEMAFAADLFQGVWERMPLRYVAHDTRTLHHGRETVFVALRTAHRDGHDFIPAAIKKGVRNFLVEKDLPYKHINYARFDDTLDGLQRWARAHRLRINYPVVGITGSNGKTTVKEWLATLMEQQYQVAKSPMSYNSQLGVALSLLQLPPQADLALIEAGISTTGEMERLREMIQPTHGILTHLGPAHADGFAAEEEKWREKFVLFEEVKTVWTAPQPEAALDLLAEMGAEIQPIDLESEQAENWREKLRIPGAVAHENAVLAATAARGLGLEPNSLHERIPLLFPVEMRTELITDNPEITVVNDSYNADPDSVRAAFQWMQTLQAHPRKQVILSDLMHLGDQQRSIQADLLREAEALFGRENVWTVGPVFDQMRGERTFSDTQSLLAHFRYEDFRHSSLLLKGARSFALEQLLPLLNPRLNATELRIDLDCLRENLRHLQSRTPDGTKIMAMVKAFSYGSGSWEIARTLEQAGVEYLSVAFASEGIALRKKGIELPIMVNNPDRQSFDALVAYQLEPQMFDLATLDAFYRIARLKSDGPCRVHLKFDTGMRRLGFLPDDLPALCDFLGRFPDLEVRSVLTHLAAADDPDEDGFSRQQLAQFETMSRTLTRQLGIQPLRHALNTAGVLRFPGATYDMVRLGIGLYGVDPTNREAPQLKEIGSLRSTISQIHAYPAGTSIGYGRSERLARDGRVGVVPIGYADGIFRRFSNGHAQFLVRGRRVPTIGRVCMDMLMLDLTELPEAQPGDEVVLFGKQGEENISVGELARAADTIPYEILTRISERVRRVFVQE